jgi:hypothetical protein
MLPGLTDDQYRALKADIAANGIIYPVVVDEGGRILDGVHRWRIAGTRPVKCARPPTAPRSRPVPHLHQPLAAWTTRTAADSGPDRRGTRLLAAPRGLSQ